MTLSLVGEEAKTFLLNGLVFAEPNTMVLRLHTGNPGALGIEHIAGENTVKKINFPTTTGNVRSNKTAAEWVEYKVKETISFVSFWFDITTENFLGYAELNEARLVEVGNTFKFPIGSITWHF